MTNLSRLAALIGACLKGGSYTVKEQLPEFLQQSAPLFAAWPETGDLNDGRDRRRQRLHWREPDVDYETRLPAQALLPQVLWPCDSEHDSLSILADQLGIDLLPKLLEPCPCLGVRHRHAEPPE